MTVFYSPKTGGFYTDEAHGARKLLVPNPSWVRPSTKVADPAWVRPIKVIPDPEFKGKKGDKVPQIAVPDMDAVQPDIEIFDERAEAPLIEIDNHACLIPKDAVPISDADHRALLDAQSGGAYIVPGPDGRPVSTTEAPAVSKAEAVALTRGKRNRLLAASDWTQMADAPLDDGQRLAWREYRQALRDITDEPNGTPWPTPPA